MEFSKRTVIREYSEVDYVVGKARIICVDFQ